MAIRPLLPTSSPQWNAEAVAKAARPKVLSGSGLCPVLPLAETHGRRAIARGAPGQTRTDCLLRSVRTGSQRRATKTRRMTFMKRKGSIASTWKQIAEPRKTQDSMTSDVCPRCGARVNASGRSRTSIGQLVAGVVCTSLLLLLIVPTWRLTSQWLEQQEQRVFDNSHCRRLKSFILNNLLVANRFRTLWPHRRKKTFGSGFIDQGLFDLRNRLSACLPFHRDCRTPSGRSLLVWTRHRARRRMGRRRPARRRKRPPDRRALYGMFPQLGAPVGFLLSGGTFLLLSRCFIALFGLVLAPLFSAGIAGVVFLWL
jgi:hypothetical protein